MGSVAEQVTVEEEWVAGLQRSLSASARLALQPLDAAGSNQPCPWRTQQRCCTRATHRASSKKLQTLGVRAELAPSTWSDLEKTW